MGQYVTPDSERPNVLNLFMPHSGGWEGYNEGLTELYDFLQAGDQEGGQTASQAYYVIFRPEADVPPGNPLPHMKRLIDMAKDHPRILRMYVVMPRTWPLAKVFARVAGSVFGFGDAVVLVDNDIAALADIDSQNAQEA